MAVLADDRRRAATRPEIVLLNTCSLLWPPRRVIGGRREVSVPGEALVPSTARYLGRKSGRNRPKMVENRTTRTFG